jgi:hypothetical protein
MSVDLAPYVSVGTALFVRIDIPDFQVLRFSNYYRPYTINGEVYSALGSLMTVSDTTSELKLSDTELTVTISGIPSTNIDSVLNYKIKGSDIQVYRGLFNANTGADLPVSPNPLGKFKGLVNNFSLNEEYDVEQNTSSVTILLTCTSVVGLLRGKLAGRRTNPVDQKEFFPQDLAMDRVPNLADSNFNFGAPRQ